jgi:hypothetical protein
LRISGAEVVILSRFIEVYESRLVLTTEYAGLKYVVYNYPTTTAALGIYMNLVVILALFGFLKFLS